MSLLFNMWFWASVVEGVVYSVECIGLHAVLFKQSVGFCVTVADVLMTQSRMKWMQGLVIWNCIVSIRAVSLSFVECSLVHDWKHSSPLMIFL